MKIIMGDLPFEKRVLVVEDDEAILGSLKELLESTGYLTEGFANGREALIYLQKCSSYPGVILLDLMMPVMDGYEFMDEKRKDPSLSSIPVVIMSAEGRSKKDNIPGEIKDYLHKPMDIDVLLEVVDKYFQNGQVQASPFS